MSTVPELLACAATPDYGRLRLRLTGRRFGRLVVLGFAGPGPDGGEWTAACDCGTTRVVNGHSLSGGDRRSCGCARFKHPRNRDLVGRVFGRLTVAAAAPRRARGEAYWRCRCSCGGESIVRSSGLLHPGGSRSCGCASRRAAAARWRRHGLARSDVYSAFSSLRCRRPPGVCPRFLASPAALAEELGPRPAGHQFGSADPAGRYLCSHADCEPCRVQGPAGTVRWMTPREKARRRGRARLLTLGGQTRRLCEWSEIVNIPASVIYNRIDKKGWPVERALTEPVGEWFRLHRPRAAAAASGRGDGVAA